MVSFSPTGKIFAEAAQLRDQGLADSMIAEELRNRGYTNDQIGKVFSGQAAPVQDNYPQMSGMPQPSAMSSLGVRGGADENIYSRVEEIAEGLIDEKWDELISEVKRIIEWKEKMEEKQLKLESAVEKLKEDFVVLHQGVLGKLESYDSQVREVGVELKAVGKVFRDVVPQFVDNVKELSSITGMMKKK